MITLDLSILNQKGTPMFYSDIFANRPAFGIVGRIFISTDTYEFYRDTGSAWNLIGGTGTGTITGSGTIGTLSKFTSSSSIGDSIVSEIGSALTINGTGKATNWYVGNPTDTNRSFSASGNANTIALWLEEYGGAGTAPDIFMNRGRGSQSSKTNIQVNDGLGGMTFAGYLNGNLNPSISFGATVVNINTTDNIADADFSIQQTYNSTTQKQNFLVRASNGNVVAPNGSFENTLTKTAISTEGWYGLASLENITIPANTNFSNLGFSLGSFIGANLMTYQGNATFANGNGTTSVFGTNGFGFSNAGSTITINQRATGINAYAGVTAFNYTTGTTNGTITHLAGIHVLAPYQTSSAILSVTNYYGALINASNERTAFNITNRWGIYQEGSNDTNYFAANCLIGSNISTGEKLQVSGSIKATSSVTATSFVKSAGTSSQILAADGSVITAGTNITISGGTISSTGGGGGGVTTTGVPTVNNMPIFTGTNTIGNGNMYQTTHTTVFGTAASSLGPRLQVLASQGTWITGCFGGNIAQSEDNLLVGNYLGRAAIGAHNGSLTGWASLSIAFGGGAVLIGTNADSGNKLRLSGSLRIDGQRSALAGGVSGQHLIIDCDGITYKIQLLNP